MAQIGNKGVPKQSVSRNGFLSISGILLRILREATRQFYSREDSAPSVERHDNHQQWPSVRQ